jgi:transaldolase
MDQPVDPRLIVEPCARIPDFTRAYEPDGMRVEEFDRYGATDKTLRGFIKAYHDLEGVIRDIVLPNPDVR